MAPNLIERIQAKIELFRLEQRYTRRRNRRSTFVSNAIYVDGEYIYQTPNATGSSTGSSSSTTNSSLAHPRVDALHQEEPIPEVAPQIEVNKKRLSRFSSMPGFGSMGAGKQQQQQDWRTSRVSDSEMTR
jgi:hypothetical protein